MAEEVVDAHYAAEPGRYQEVLDHVVSFYADYIQVQPELEHYTIAGDPGQGVVKALVTWKSRGSAAAVNSDPKFAEFADTLKPLMSAPVRRDLFDHIETHVRPA